MRKKIKLNSLQVKSFITSIDKKEKQTIEGMENMDNNELSRLVCFFKKTKRFLIKPVETFRGETPCTQSPDLVSRLGSCYPYHCPDPLPNCSVVGVSCK